MRRPSYPARPCRLLLGGERPPAEELALGLLAGDARQDRLAGRLGLGDLALAREPVLGDRLGLDAHLDVAVPRHAGACRDELADDHVLLETEQAVRAAGDGRLGQDPRGLLERRRRQPRVGREGRLGDPEQLRPGARRLTAVLDGLAIGGLEPAPVDQVAREELGVPRLDDLHLAQHLPNDQLDVLVVDRDALRAVYLLDLLHQVRLQGLNALDAQLLERVDGPLGQLLPDLDLVAVADEQAGPEADLVLHGVAAVLRRDGDPALLLLVVVLDLDRARDLGDPRLALGAPRLEQLDDARQAVRDVLARHASGVEGSHRELCAGLADRLRGNDAHGLADVHQPAGRERPAVAQTADAVLGLARGGRTHPDHVHAGLDQMGRDLVVEHVAARGNLLAVDLDVLGEHAAVQGRVEVLVLDVSPGRGLVRDGHRHRTVGAAVLLADDQLLRDVHQAPGEVPGVGGSKRCVGQTLARAVGRDEVLEHGQALAEVRLDRPRDDLALRVGHQAAHAGDLADLHDVPAGTRVGHHVDRVGLAELGLHRVLDLVGRIGPDRDELLTALVVGDDALAVLGLDPRRVLLVPVQDLRLVGRGRDVLDAEGHAGSGGVVEPDVLQVVEDLLDLRAVVAVHAGVDQAGDVALQQRAVDELLGVGEALVEDEAPDRGLDHGHTIALGSGIAVGALRQHLGRQGLARQPYLDDRVQSNLPMVEGHQGLVHRTEPRQGLLVLDRLRLQRQVVDPEHHVLRRHGDRTAVGRRQDVVGRQHEHAGLGLPFGRQPPVDRHLVAVEVGVERGAHQRMDLDRLALDEHGLERLDPEAVQRRGPVQQHRVLLDDLLEHVPDLRTGALDHALGALDVLRQRLVHQPLHHERLEQLQRHLLGQAALVQAELRADHDDRAARVVHALAEQVLPEPALLALEHVAERLQRAVAGPGDGAAAPAVVEQRVDGLLQHPLLVVDDDLGRLQVELPPQPVVPVDHAAVQVVEVRGREPPAVQLHHRAQVRRDHGHGVQHHAHGRVATLGEVRDHLEALDGLEAARALAGRDLLAQRVGLLLQLEVLEQALDRLGAHAAVEVVAEPLAERPVDGVIGHQLLDRQPLERGQDLVQVLGVALGGLGDPVDVALGLAAGGRELRALGALALELAQAVFQLGQPALDLVVAVRLELTLLLLDLLLDLGQVLVAALVVDARDDVGGEVDDPLEVLGGDVQQVAEATGDALEVPDVGDRGGELDVAHPVAADLAAGDLDAAALADDALEPDALVLAAVALPVPRRSEDPLAEQAVLLRLEGPVVDRLRLLHLAVGPRTDLIRGGQADPDLVEVIDVQHLRVRLLAHSHHVQRFRVPDVPRLVVVGSRRLPTRQVDPELLGRAEHVLVGLLELDLLALCRTHLDVQAQGLHLLDQHLEGLGDPRLGDVLALDDRLVDLHAAEHVVGLDREELLERVGRAVRLERPHLHLPEPLAAELRLPAQRLLGDHRVGAGRPGVDLVVHQVQQLQDVAHPDRHGLLVRLAAPAVVQDRLADVVDQPHAVLVGMGAADRLEDLVLARAVEHRRGHVHRAFVVDTVLAEPDQTGPAQVRLEHLPEVHPARHAERVQDDVDRRPVRQERHVLLGQDRRDHALVAVAAGELVAVGDLPLLGHVHADQLVDAGRQLVALLAREYPDADHLAALAVRDLERGVAHLARLLAEDRA